MEIARDFDNYMENPTITEKGLELMQRVVKELKEEGFEE